MGARYLRVTEYYGARDGFLHGGGPEPAPPTCWPARVTVTQSGKEAGLAAEDGKIYVSETDFLLAMQEHSSRQPPKPLRVVNCGARLAWAEQFERTGAL